MISKKDIKLKKRILERLYKELGPIKKEESEARRLWSLGYNKYNNAVVKLKQRTKDGLTVDPIDKKGKVNQTVKKLWDTVDGWPEKSIELTKKRDTARKMLAKKGAEIIAEEKELERVLSEHKLQTKQTDGIINNVFLLNGSVVLALEHMDKFLSSDVFPLLPDKSTQKTIESYDGKKRIVIMTNHITWMDTAKAEEAKREIEKFFARINPKEEDGEDETIQMLSELLKELLVVKIKVKAGPNLSRFLSLELNKDKFPELVEAQKLLASATDYQRSGKYVRLYEREHKDDKWEPVRQS